MRTLSFRLLLALGLAVALTACAAPSPTPVAATATAQPAAETVPPPAVEPTAAPPTAVPPTATAEPSATPAPPTPEPNATPVLIPGPEVQYNGVQVTVASAVAGGVSAHLEPASTPSPDVVEFAINPAFTDLELTGYPTQNKYWQPRIQVYPVAEYEQLSPAAARVIAALRTLLAERPATPPEHLPLLPIVNAAQVLHTQVQYLSFQGGSGVRFITQYDQAYLPINNQELFYTFQGLTADGAYYVSAILPVSAPFLAASDRYDAPLPEGGVPFPDTNSADPEAAFMAYLQAVAQKLSDPSAALTPDLATLDALVQSIRVSP